MKVLFNPYPFIYLRGQLSVPVGYFGCPLGGLFETGFSTRLLVVALNMMIVLPATKRERIAIKRGMRQGEPMPANSVSGNIAIRDKGVVPTGSRNKTIFALLRLLAVLESG